MIKSLVGAFGRSAVGVNWVGGKEGYLKILDQTCLPLRRRYLICRSVGPVIDAIKGLKVRGAPAIGVAAAFGLFLGTRAIKTSHYPVFLSRLKQIKNRLFATRSTAVNLGWALERMMQVTPISKRIERIKRIELPRIKYGAANRLNQLTKIKNKLFQEALAIQREDIRTCERIGKNGARLVRNGMGILTYCNAGLLATAGKGTALAVIYEAKRRGKKFQVYVPETRPLLQGARLTAWELTQAHIPCTVICDNMAGKLMKDGKIDLVLVGADRIAANGDTANKIGTYSLAVLAHYHKIPFYVVAPQSTFDRSIKDGSRIPIEHRSEGEITTLAGKRIVPYGVKAYNPAFDITPAKLITGIITETGMIKP